MPRNYVKKGTTGQWSQQPLESALKKVGDGMTVSAAAKRFGIPKQTLHNYYSVGDKTSLKDQHKL